MNYKLQLGHYDGGKWKTTSPEAGSDYACDFEHAKERLLRISDKMKDSPELYMTEVAIGARLIDELPDPKPPRIIHYITPYYPDVSLPSTK